MLRCRNIDKSPSTWYEVAEGATFIENYNETLDSGTIVIQQLTSKIDIEPYDVFEIETYDSNIDIETRRLCVDTYTCTQTSLNPPIYRYEISLFSETKLLEGILCPSLAVTKLAVGTPRTVWYYLEKYLNAYCPKTDSNEYWGAITNKWIYSLNVQSKFNSIECPEMQWNEPTFREVLTDLMMVADCIPTLKNGVISYIDISQVGSEISDIQRQGINYIQESQSSEDYVSELKMELVNATNNSVPTGSYDNIDSTNLPSDATRIVEKIGFRNDESYLLTTENIRLQTSFPIWKIHYCKCVFTLGYSFRVKFVNTGTEIEWNQYLDTGRILKDSSVNYIPEYTEWLTKDVLYGAWSSGGQDLDTRYRNTCLYYIRGAKNILNFNDKIQYQILWIQNTTYVWDMIANGRNFKNEATVAALNYINRWNENFPNNRVELVLNSVNVGNPNYKEATFEVSYEPISECVFRASKSPLQKHVRQVMDNQTNSYIDVKRQGMLEYFKANRLGNKLALVNGRYYSDEIYLPTLSQKINNKIIFRKEIAYFNNYINVNYQTIENYVLRDYFTGVKSKLRSWRVISGNEALVRAELLKFYVSDNIPSIFNETMVIPSYTNLQTYFDNFKYCIIRFNVEDGGTRPVAPSYAGTTVSGLDAISIEFTKHRVGNSVVFTIQMPDNFYAGNYVSNYSGTDDRVEQKGIGYTDDNGEVTGGIICFYNQSKEVVYIDENQTRAIKPYTEIGLSGTAGATGLVAQIPFTCYKDNKEILQISIQFELNDEANDMFLGYKEEE